MVSIHLQKIFKYVFGKFTSYLAREKAWGNKASRLFTDFLPFYLKDNWEEKEVEQNLILPVRVRKGEINVYQVPYLLMNKGQM